MRQQLDLEVLATRYWAITVPLLVIGISYPYFGYVPVIALTIIQLLHYYSREDRITAFSVQVRIAYLALLLLSMIAVFQWMAWALLVGTIIRVLFNYCFLARSVSLLPWNRSAPLSWVLINRTFLTPPTHGSILRVLETRS